MQVSFKNTFCLTSLAHYSDVIDLLNKSDNNNSASISSNSSSSSAANASMCKSLTRDTEFNTLIKVVNDILARGRSAVTKQQQQQQNATSHASSNHMVEMRVCKHLLSSLYAWITDATTGGTAAAGGGNETFSFDLSTKVTIMMTVCLELFLNELKKHGCQIIFANFSKVIFATNKHNVSSEIITFWNSLVSYFSQHSIFKSLSFDLNSITQITYGMLWYDKVNYATIPIDPENGSISWTVDSHWQMADYLPPAMRAPLYTYVSEFLLRPLRALDRLSSMNETVISNAQKNLEISQYILQTLIPYIRKKLYTFVSEADNKRQSDFMIINNIGTNNNLIPDDLKNPDDEDQDNTEEEEEAMLLEEMEEGSPEDDPAIQELRQKHKEKLQLKRIAQLKHNWEFPNIPGGTYTTTTGGASVITATLNPIVEFAKYICEIFLLDKSDNSIHSALLSIRADLLTLLKIKPFAKEAKFENPKYGHLRGYSLLRM